MEFCSFKATSHIVYTLQTSLFYTVTDIYTVRYYESETKQTRATNAKEYHVKLIPVEKNLMLESTVLEILKYIQHSM